MTAWPIEFVKGSKPAKKNEKLIQNYRRKITKKSEEIILFPSKLTTKEQKRRIGNQRKRKVESQTEAKTVEEIKEDRESESASVKC